MARLGGVDLTVHLTAGHTPGCTTWSMRIQGGDKPYDVVVLCQVSLPGNPTLMNDPNYPEIPADFTRTFTVLKSLPCDVFLSEHGSVFDLQAKIKRMQQPGTGNPFVDPDGYRRYVAGAQEDFEKELAVEQHASP